MMQQMENEKMELLDAYVRGKLSREERYKVQERMLRDEQFRLEVEAHEKLVGSIKAYGDRAEAMARLASIDKEFFTDSESTGKVGKKITPPRKSAFKKYWPMAAVAASVALVSIVGTLLMTKSLASDLETKQTAIYKELRKNFEQIQRSQSRMMENIARSTEKPVPPGRYGGSGFLVSANGYVVTSHHVVVGADSVYIENPLFGPLKTSVVLSDDTNDIAILRIEDPSFHAPRPLSFLVSSTEAHLGEEVFTLGFPREDIVFGEGSISALTGFRQNPNSYQISVPVNPGNSGGPLFNERGDLVGIISGIQTETTGAAFAIKSSVLLNVIEGIPADSVHQPLVLPRQNQLKQLSRVERVKKWKDNVFVVRVYARK
jgi:serine protease Do